MIVNGNARIASKDEEKITKAYYVNNNPVNENIIAQDRLIQNLQKELAEAREIIKLQNDMLCTVYTENSSIVVKAKAFLIKE